jgi:integrase
MPRYRGGAGRVQALNGRQAGSVLKYLKGIGDRRNTLLWALGTTTGLRISDLLRLRVCNLKDVDDRIAKTFEVRESKTGKTRVVHVMAVAREALADYIEGERPADDDYLFPSPNGERPITREQARRLIKGWCNAVNLKGIFGTHTLRKTFATIAYANSGSDPVATARVTGHSNPAQLLRYIGQATKTELEILGAMDRAFSA